MDSCSAVRVLWSARTSETASETLVGATSIEPRFDRSLSLARDLGEKLGSGAHLTGLRRTRIGPYQVENAISIDNFIKNIELL